MQRNFSSPARWKFKLIPRIMREGSLKRCEFFRISGVRLRAKLAEFRTKNAISRFSRLNSDGNFVISREIRQSQREFCTAKFKTRAKLFGPVLSLKIQC
jgi:hypothetical protein